MSLRKHKNMNFKRLKISTFALLVFYLLALGLTIWAQGNALIYFFVGPILVLTNLGATIIIISCWWAVYHKRYFKLNVYSVCYLALTALILTGSATPLLPMIGNHLYEIEEEKAIAFCEDYGEKVNEFFHEHNYYPKAGDIELPSEDDIPILVSQPVDVYLLFGTDNGPYCSYAKWQEAPYIYGYYDIPTRSWKDRSIT